MTLKSGILVALMLLLSLTSSKIVALNQQNEDLEQQFQGQDTDVQSPNELDQSGETVQVDKQLIQNQGEDPTLGGLELGQDQDAPQNQDQMGDFQDLQSSNQIDQKPIQNQSAPMVMSPTPKSDIEYFFDDVAQLFGVNKRRTERQQSTPDVKIPQNLNKKNQTKNTNKKKDEVIPQTLKQNFQNFGRQYSKNYNPQESNYRFKIYQQSANRVPKQNSKPNSYRIAVNQFSDLALKQFQDKYLMMDPPQMPMIEAPPMLAPPQFEVVPIDWREKMSEAKHQGKCGSCYAFSVIGVMETMFKIQKNENVQLSVQQLVDCCKTGCNGCRGGWPVSVLQYLGSAGNVWEQEYPYKSKQQKCGIQDKSTMNFLQQSNPFSQVTDVYSLAYALQSGPVSVIMDASSWDPLYKSGVFDKCPNEQKGEKVRYNHAVICVGINSQEEWVVRNSWGKNWGDEGHIHLPKGNSCGITDMGVIPNFRTYDTGLGLAAPQFQEFN